MRGERGKMPNNYQGGKYLVRGVRAIIRSTLLRFVEKRIRDDYIGE